MQSENPSEVAPDSAFGERLLRESLRALSIGSGYGAALVFLIGLFVAFIGWKTGVPFAYFWPLLAFVFSCAMLVFLLYLVARRGVTRPVWIYAIFAALATAPSTFFLLCEISLPAGAATYLQSPANVAYFPFIALTALAFDLRLSIFTGACASASFLVAYLFAEPELLAVIAPDPSMQRVIASPAPFYVRVFALLVFGVLIGVVSSYTKALFGRLLEEEHRRTQMRRVMGALVSDEVVDRTLRDAGVSSGEKVRVAILFADIRGFTSLSESLQPEDLVAQLNEYFDAITAPIVQAGGVIDKFIGDAVMAVFGGLAPLEQPASAAVAAAFEMQVALDRLNAARAARNLPALRMGVGVHLAEVLQGAIGSASRKDYTVIGDGVNTASRVQAATKKLGCTIAITEDAGADLPDALRERLMPAGRVRLRGKAEPVGLLKSGF